MDKNFKENIKNDYSLRAMFEFFRMADLVAYM